jgi:hypothetical protein
MPNEVTWRVTPQVFSDIHAIIAKHGIGLGFIDEESMELFGRVWGPSAAAVEILDKYQLRPYIPLKLVVDYRLKVCAKPEYDE